ncbi:dihydroorotate dehydrogenase electron transfer subunit [Natranaerovirga pectinivora]|uniref:Dihydroorotate dehydrogenase B (NAD(+)), electron transfer subunit n=1 Tax=Natranaerovirga pectinivora TaxID=682400 RepID=A0A4R3MNT5_9FIRM|nr:dihydroorotate dehydrogenase electron transfer subunit [Natranaerovirga pectinivora]TCT14349.1 dihydroorotate dehydrogenase electron transfer subunit [Natranaerovirga pectinivora]
MSLSKIKVATKIMKHSLIATDVYEMWIENKEMAKAAKVGQFVALYCKDGSRLLPRPISICEIDNEEGRLRLVYRVFGAGTKEISCFKEGETIEVLGPLGNGFLTKDKNVSVIVGGGIGVPPLLELCKQLKGEKHIFLGYRDTVFLADEFKAYGDVYIATEDGSVGHKGNVMTLLKEKGLDIDQVYACGPKGMLKALQSYVLEEQIPAQLSVEEKMACGIGACVGCICETNDRTMKNKRVCKEGPVFSAEEVVL